MITTLNEFKWKSAGVGESCQSHYFFSFLLFALAKWASKSLTNFKIYQVFCWFFALSSIDTIWDKIAYQVAEKTVQILPWKSANIFQWNRKITMILEFCKCMHTLNILSLIPMHLIKKSLLILSWKNFFRITFFLVHDHNFLDVTKNHLFLSKWHYYLYTNAYTFSGHFAVGWTLHEFHINRY